MTSISRRHLTPNRPDTISIPRGMSPADSPRMPATVQHAEIARRRLPMKKMSARCDTAAAVAYLADELLNPPPGAAGAPAVILDHLRRRLHAIDALVWLCDGTRASRALHVGRRDQTGIAPLVPLDDTAAAIHRLRLSGTVLCRVGDVTGLESLVPAGVGPFAAAAAMRGDAVIAVLIIGWAEARPPCDEGELGQLRIAATLLAKSLTTANWGRTHDDLSDAILTSLAGRIAVIDRSGTIIASTGAIQRGQNYLEGHRRAAGAGRADARAIVEGIEAVLGGTSPAFQTAYVGETAGEQRSCLMTVTPLRRADGGAVITDVDLSRGTVTDLAEAMSRTLFERLAGTLPVPVWIVEPDGRLVFGNERWLEAAGGTPPSASAVWTDLLHPEDRDRAVSAFGSSASRGERFEMEFRLKGIDGSYRWSTCSAAPRYAADGRLDGYVGVCWDASAKRLAESAFTQIAGKLVAAQETERSRIARELHDDLAQQVGVLASKLDTVGRSPRQTHRIQQILADAQASVREIASSIHAMSHKLHPAKLRLLGLVRTLEALCRDESNGTGVQVTFRAEGVRLQVANDVALCLFRVAQEALSNALKHSEPTTIVMSLEEGPEQLSLTITDNGNGFDPLASQSTGLDLLTMRERVELVSGTLAVGPARPHGTTIRVVVPLKGAGATPLPSPPDDAAPPPAPVPVRSPRRASAGPGPGSTG